MKHILLFIETSFVIYTLAAQFEQSSESIQTYENDNFVYSLEKELRLSDVEVRLFCYIDIFLYDPEYHDEQTGKVFPAIRLKKQNSENSYNEQPRLDKETICNDLDRQCFVTIKLLIIPNNGIEKVFSLSIELLDQNDMAPTFLIDFSQHTLNLCKASLVNSMNSDIFLAQDDDQGTLSYEIRGANSLALSIPSQRTTLPTSQLQLKLTDKFNYIRGEVQQAVVEVTDTKHKTEQAVKIAIDEACQNAYSFAEPVYRTVVEENTKSQRTDIILESNGQLDKIEYAITDRRAREYLSIDQRTGEVFLYKEVDYEKRKQIRTIVELRDIQTKTVYDFAHLIISIKDINDNIPKIKYTVISPATMKNGIIEIEENTPKDVAILYIETRDSDMSSAGVVDVELHGDNKFFSYSMGFIWLSRVLDREEQNFLQLSIRSCDQGKPIKCTTETIEFNILDKNDHEPYFTRCPTKVYEIPEDAEVEKFITTVRATDGDRINGYSSPFGDITYYVTNSDVISIDYDGRIFLNQKLDREQTSEYEFFITARDGGNPSNEAVCVLNVKVIDINDSFPNLNRTQRNVRISSALKKGELVTTINGTDNDLGEFGRIQYHLADDFGLFEIIGLSIVVKQDFVDFLPGVKETYNLSLIAEDGGGLKTRHVIKIDIVSPEALQNDAAFTTMSLLGGIFAGAMTVLLIFIAVVVIFKRRRQDQSAIAKPTNYKVSKAGYPDWAIEVPSDGNCSSGLTITGDHNDSDSNGSKLNSAKKFSHLKTVRVNERNDSHESNSDHITDSGKGESEHESFTSNNLNGALQVQNMPLQSKNNHTIRSVINQSKFGPHCVQECGIYGHSDSCWLNNITLVTSRSRREHKSQLDVQVSSITEFNLDQFNRTRSEFDSRYEVDLTPIESTRSALLASQTAPDVRESVTNSYSKERLAHLSQQYIHQTLKTSPIKNVKLKNFSTSKNEHYC